MLAFSGEQAIPRRTVYLFPLSQQKLALLCTWCTRCTFGKYPVFMSSLLRFPCAGEPRPARKNPPLLDRNFPRGCTRVKPVWFPRSWKRFIDSQCALDNFLPARENPDTWKHGLKSVVLQAQFNMSFLCIADISLLVSWYQSADLLIAVCYNYLISASWYAPVSRVAAAGHSQRC